MFSFFPFSSHVLYGQAECGLQPHWRMVILLKSAISIPDKVFAEAERLSRRLKKSRSQVYTEAVTEYIARHNPEAVTEAMNRVCEVVDTYPDPAISAAARRTLEGVEW